MQWPILLAIIADEATNAPPEFTQLFIKTIFLLIGLLGLVASGMWLLRRFGFAKYDAQGPQSKMNVLERKSLSPKCCVWMVAIDQQTFLVVDGTQGVAVTQIHEYKQHEQKQAGPQKN